MIKKSHQDTVYLQVEGDDFFERNFANKQVPELRMNKQSIVDQLDALDLRPAKVLEYGCNYGDMLSYFREKRGAIECVGVEASGKAVEFGRKHYGDKIRLVQGTIAENSISADPAYNNYFDLVVIEDVFGWVSRETLFQSIANIDGALKDGGHIFIRDFYPGGKVKNANHHVKDGTVFNFKVPGAHASLFTGSGIYEIVSQRIFVDKSSMAANFKTHREFESRLADTILKKSYSNYYVA